MAYLYDFKKTSINVIANFDNLIDVLDVTKKEFHDALTLSDSKKYTSFPISKSDGTKRTVYSPHKDIRRLQRRINRRIFNPKDYKQDGLISWPSYLYGSIPNDPRINDTFSSSNELTTDNSRDYIACAKNHCGARAIMKMDISNFFDNIHENQVLSIFKKLLKFPDDVAKALTSICCFQGSVIQGALTSSYIASAVLFEVEAQTVIRLRRKN